MRVTANMLMNHYAQALDDKFAEWNKYSQQLTNSMEFDRPSDDPVAAMKTIKACHDYANNQQYQTSVSETSSWMDSTETTVNEISTVLTSAQEKVSQMLNGTNSGSDYGNYAVALSNYSDEIVTALNKTYAGQYIFGGSSEDTNAKAPFKIDQTTGHLAFYDYNNKFSSGYSTYKDGYVDVSQITSADIDKTKLSMKVDIGLGGNADFDAATSGLQTIITSPDTINKTSCNNIVDELNEAVKELNAGSTDKLNTLLSDISNAQDAVLKVKVDVGERSSMLKTLGGNLTDDETNITKSLATSMEGDSTKAVYNFNMAGTVYKETMSISSSVLQNSLFDFLK